MPEKMIQFFQIGQGGFYKIATLGTNNHGFRYFGNG